MTILGIDIAKKTFDVTLIDVSGARHHHQFANTAAGFQHLHRWLRAHAISTLHACMEATNL